MPSRHKKVKWTKLLLTASNGGKDPGSSGGGAYIRQYHDMKESERRNCSEIDL